MGAKKHRLQEEVRQAITSKGPTRLWTIQQRMGKMLPGHRTRRADAQRVAARAQQ